MSLEWRVECLRGGVVYVEEMTDQQRGRGLGTYKSIKELPEWTQQSLAMLDLLSMAGEIDSHGDSLGYSHPHIGTRLKAIYVYYLVYRGDDAKSDTATPCEETKEC